MNRHRFRWENLAFGLMFVSVVGNWAVWDQDLLTARELSLTAAGVLIVLGVAGIAATVRRSRTPLDTEREGAMNEAADPKP
jgi:uncharacterized membrane protein YqjE